MTAAAGPALADDRADARVHYDKATAAYALGRYADAAAEFEQAFTLKPDPAILYNAAQAYRLAGNKERALQLYRSYLRVYGRRAEHAPDVEWHIGELEKVGPAPRPAAPVERASLTAAAPTAPRRRGRDGAAAHGVAPRARGVARLAADAAFERRRPPHHPALVVLGGGGRRRRRRRRRRRARDAQVLRLRRRRRLLREHGALMRTLGSSSRATVLFGTSLVLGATACAPDRTMLVVRVESDLAVPAAMDSVHVVVTHAGHELQNLQFSLKPGAHVLPLQVGLLSPSGGSADVEIDVSGSLGATFVVGQDAVTSFVKGKSLVVDMFLAAACVGFDCDDPNKTCTKGQACVAKDRAADMLPAFDPHPPHAASDAAAGGAGGSSGDGDAADGPTSTDGARRGDSAAGSGGVVVEAGAEAPADGPADRTIEAAPEVMPGCVPKTEDCLNGLDDDCDGLADCADPDCVPTTVCVPSLTGQVGTTITAGTCPAGFAPRATRGRRSGSPSTAVGRRAQAVSAASRP